MLTHARPAVSQSESRLTAKLTSALAHIGRTIGQRLEPLGKSLLVKAAEEEDERRAIDDINWSPIADAAATELVTVARDGAEQVLAALGIEAGTDQIFASAEHYARMRSAELVGKTWDEHGELFDNPDADMAISDTVRDEIRAAVADAVESGDSAAELGDRIRSLPSFSPERATLIARTEIIRAHGQGQLAALKASGVVEKKGWSTSTEPTVCDECQANEDEGAVDIEDEFPSGDDAPPAHPACMCALIAVLEEHDESDDEDEDEDESQGGDADSDD